MRSLQPITSVGYRSTVNLVRPSNTTAYTALDVIGVADVSVAANAGSAVLTFADIGPAGGEILITAADLMISVAAVPAGMTTFVLHLYDTSPTAILDNAAFDIPSGDRTGYLGSITIPAPTDYGATLFSTTDKTATQGQFKLADGSTSLYGELVTTTGYTPTSAAAKRIRLHAVGV